VDVGSERRFSVLMHPEKLQQGPRFVVVLGCEAGMTNSCRGCLGALESKMRTFPSFHSSGRVISNERTRHHPLVLPGTILLSNTPLFGDLVTPAP
jgi:hypothetical protein